MGTLGTYLLIGFFGCVLGLFAFAWLAKGVFGQHFATFDDQTLRWLYGNRTPLLTQVMLAFTFYGQLWILAGIVTLFTLALLWAREWANAIALLLSSGGAGAIDQTLKTFFQRTRPDIIPGPIHLTSYSFPSGHAMSSLATYGILAFIGIRLIHQHWARIALVVSAVILIIGIGMSRPYLGVHYPTDVIAGYLAGAVWLTVVIEGVETAKWRTWRKKWRASRQPGATTPERE